MPGLKQLNAFTNKLLSLGNETESRMASGEPRRQIPLPPNAKEDDDSGDFIFGLTGSEAPTQDEDDDFLADLGIGEESAKSSDDDFFANLDVDDAATTPKKNNLPSVEDILSDPDAHAADEEPADDFLADLGIPDLPAESPITPEVSSPTENQILQEDSSEPIESIDNPIENIDSIEPELGNSPDPFAGLEESLVADPLINSDSFNNADPFAGLGLDPLDTFENNEPLEGVGPLGDGGDSLDKLEDPFATPIEDVVNNNILEGLETLGEVDSFATSEGEIEEYPDLSDLEMPQEFNLSGDVAGTFENTDTNELVTEDEADPFASIMEEAEIEEEAPRHEEAPVEEPAVEESIPEETEPQIDLSDALAIDDLGGMDLDLSNLMSSVESLLSDTPSEEQAAVSTDDSLETASDFNDSNTFTENDSFDTTDDFGDNNAFAENDSFDTTDDFGDNNTFAENLEETESFSIDENPLAGFDFDDFSAENTDTDATTDFSTSDELDTSLDSPSDESFDTEFPSADSLPSLDDLPHNEDEFDTNIETGDETLDNLDLSDLGLDGDLGSDFGLDGSTESDFGSDFGDDLNLDTAIGGDIPDLDFPETDTTLGDGMDFGDDEFALPTVPTPEELKKTATEAKQGVEFDENFSVGEQVKKQPRKPAQPINPNEFTDEEYKRFIYNLNAYPLNLRIAIEELIVKNEFTDDVVSALIRRIIKKATPRQIASEVGKLIDKPISVPRDFEKRTAEQYELYKQSVEYQIKNRVLPAFFMTIAAGIVGYILFFVGMRFVYEPIHAHILYSQGYDLLELESYPQAEQKFDQAYEKRPMKNWFFTYAAGYREKKQFERARQVYEFGLRVFNNDKQIATEYARMETLDLANYERSEEIVRRHILDFHINDPEGLLLLGDIYLEWATEKDSAKFEDARSQYATLIELYGAKDIYLSRMLRYFIRTDNLREVLPLNDHFFNQKDALSPEDIIELSGYLLEKQFGYLSPTDEYLRTYIEDVYDLLNRALDEADTHPEAYYNMSKYFLYTNNRTAAKDYLNGTLIAFDMYEENRTRKLISKNIDSYRLLGNLFGDEEEYLRAEELYTQAIDMYEREKDVSSLKPNEIYGKLYEDMGNINYFISGDLEMAYIDYNKAITELNDTPTIRYKLGYIEYANGNYLDALNTFIKTSTEAPEDTNLLLAMGNVLALRGDYFASQAYYDMLLTNLETERAQRGVLVPQIETEDGEFVSIYMWAANNSAVTLYRLAQQTGNSAMNAKAMVQFSESSRAWDALTRNPETLVRLDGTNLAAENLRYVIYPRPDFEPEIYTTVNRTLFGEEHLIQSSVR